MPRPNYEPALTQPAKPPTCETFKPRELATHYVGGVRVKGKTMTVCANCGGLPHESKKPMQQTAASVCPEGMVCVPFHTMLQELREAMEMTQVAFAAMLDISPQYLNDLEKQRRLPSINVVKAICDVTGRGPIGALAWHRAGAIAHGWEIASLKPIQVKL